MISKNSKRLSYSAVAGALLTAQQAQGVVDFQVFPDGMSIAPSDSYDVDVSISGNTYTMSLSLSAFGFGSTFTNGAQVFGATDVGILRDQGVPMRLSFGSNIGPGAGSFAGGGVLGEVRAGVTQTFQPIYTYTPTNGGYLWIGTSTNTFPVRNESGDFLGRNGFIGIVLSDALNSTNYYGWMEVEVGPDAESLTLYGWGFDTEGNAINAGAIPEANHFGLLVGGAAGLLAWRRKKRVAA